MADYWKSQPRHFCDFCKCWTADNKPSRDFHERGKRHQENVKKKLDDLRKKGVADAKQEKETSSYMKQMERAALMQLKKDLTENPTMASQYGVVLKSKEEKSEEKPVVESQQSDVWCEATTPDGYTYYWNTATMESRWELPGASELSGTSAEPETSEQPNQKSEAVFAEEDSEPPLAKKKKQIESDKDLLPKTEEAAASETFASTSDVLPRDCAVDSPVKCERASTPPVNEAAEAVPESSEAEPIEDVSSIRLPRPNQPLSAYGKWQQVLHDNDEQHDDLQLPVEANQVVEQTLVFSSEPKMKFREKKVTTSFASTGEASVGFRKPKSKIQRSIRTTDLSEES